MAPRGKTRAARSISSVAAASAPSRRQKQATVVSRDHERATGRHSTYIIGQPLELSDAPDAPDIKLSFIRINLPKELKSLP